MKTLLSVANGATPLAPTISCSCVASRYDRRCLDHQDHALLGRAGAMHDAFRHDEALIGQKLNRAAFKVDDEPSTQDEEELVVVVVFVPVVFALHHAKAHHRLVHPAEGLVVPLVRDGLGQDRYVDELQGVELDIEMCSIRVGSFSHSVASLSFQLGLIWSYGGVGIAASYCALKVGAACPRRIGGGFHFPVNASLFGA